MAPRTRRSFVRALETELELVEGAIRLVAAGAASRVIVANLRYGRVVMEPARSLAVASAVSLAALPAADGARIDVEVSAAGADTPAVPPTAAALPESVLAS